MPFLRDAPLVSTVDQIVQLTGRTDLRNLEASGELDLEDLLLSSSKTIYDRLQAQGVQPGRIKNAHVYENAVAWQFLGVLAESGALGDEDPEALFARSDRYFNDVRPDTGDAEVATAEGTPAVQNVTAPPFKGALRGDV